MKIVNLFGVGVLIYILSGCAGTSPSMRCTPAMIKQGYFCYNGINFGKNLSPMYKRGVVDGCRTGQGYFFKDYELFNFNIPYQKGWIEGRKRCRPNYDDRYMNQTKPNSTYQNSNFDDGLTQPPRSDI
jgi:hypothetical protein